MGNDILPVTKTIRYSEASPAWRVNADICVAGAGMSGLSAALEAAWAGKKVVLLDGQGQLGGQTYNSCIGHFTTKAFSKRRPAASVAGTLPRILRSRHSGTRKLAFA